MMSSGLPAIWSIAVPTSLVVGAQQSYPYASNTQAVVLNYGELTSPDLSNSTSVYFTFESAPNEGPSATGQLDCAALVSTLSASQGQPTTITVPFSYTIQAVNTAKYETWTVCVQGTLTLFSVPIELSSSAPVAYIVTGATGTRSLYNVYGGVQTNRIIGVAAGQTQGGNIVYTGATNNFGGAGLTFVLDGPAAINAEYQPGVTDYNYITVVSGSYLSESGMDYATQAPSRSNLAVQFPGQPTVTLPTCPVSPYNTNSNTTVLFRWTAAVGNASICMSGSLTLGSQFISELAETIQVTANGAKPWYPVLAATGSRVYTDVNGLSFVQSISLSPEWSFSSPSLPISYTQAGHNDNLLATLNGTINNATTILSASSNNNGILFNISAVPYYPNVITPYLTNVLLGYTSGGGVVDPFLVGAAPSNNLIYILTPTAQAANPSSTAFFTCPVTTSVIPPTIPNPSVPYYWYYNNPIIGVGRECMSGTVNLGSTLTPSSGGLYSFPVLSISGTRYFYQASTNTTTSNTLVGLSTAVAGVDQRMGLVTPFLTTNGVGLQFSSALQQTFNPFDTFDSQSSTTSSTYNFTALQNSGAGIVETNQYLTGSSAGVFNVSTDPSLAAQCSATLVQTGLRATNWSQVLYFINGSYSFCGSLLVEWDPSTSSGGYYNVLAVQGNRSWTPSMGAIAQMSTVLGLAPAGSESNGGTGIDNGGYGDNLFSPNCPYFTHSGMDIETSCPTCAPANQSPINLWRQSTSCSSYVNEDNWYNYYPDTSHSMVAAPWIPGQALPLGSCPAGTPAPVPAYLCLVFYSLPGDVDFPWSSAISLSVSYTPTLVTTSAGTAVQIVSGQGTRVYTNRFGNQLSTTVSVAGVQAGVNNNLLYLGSLTPVDTQGLLLTLSTPIQLPGVGATVLTSTIDIFNQTSSGIVQEDQSSRIDGGGQAFLSTVAGFTNVTIGAANINALAVNLAACQAPISFTNGLRPPTQPSVSNGAATFYYRYTVSDGATYSVSGNLTFTASSGFASVSDQLGNPYQSIVNITGTRQYTYLPTGQTLISTVAGLSTGANALADQRFYPYTLLAAAPGVYTVATAPFFDHDGCEFNISPPAPINGLPIGTGTQYNATTLYFTTPEPTAVLTEGYYTNLPVVSFQRQLYSLTPL